MGSVFKRGKHWCIRYDAPPAIKGKRNEKKISCRGLTKRQAEQRLAEIEADVSRGIYMEPSETTVAEHMLQWLERQEHRGLSPATIAAYETNCRIHILPLMGRHQLGRLRRGDVQGFVDKLTDRGLSPKTIKNIHGILHTALDQAIRLEKLPSNPADKIDLPRWVRKRITTATADDLGALMVAIEQSKYRIPILIGVGTGARRGEILALRWEDIDLQAGIIQVRRSVLKISGERIVKTTKTANGERDLAIGPTLIDILTKHKAAQNQRQCALGDLYSDLGWVCAHGDGLPLTPSGLSSEMYRIKLTLGLKSAMHGLRHTWVTEQLAAGVPDEIVSKGAGHATIGITHDIYGHTQQRHQAATIAVSERLLNSKPQIKVLG